MVRPQKTLKILGKTIPGRPTDWKIGIRGRYQSLAQPHGGVWEGEGASPDQNRGLFGTNHRRYLWIFDAGTDELVRGKDDEK